MNGFMDKNHQKTRTIRTVGKSVCTVVTHLILHRRHFSKISTSTNSRPPSQRRTNSYKQGVNISLVCAGTQEMLVSEAVVALLAGKLNLSPHFDRYRFRSRKPLLQLLCGADLSCHLSVCLKARAVKSADLTTLVLFIRWQHKTSRNELRQMPNVEI
jgi:hypothetical protein